jgi:hypothetical protein
VTDLPLGWQRGPADERLRFQKSFPTYLLRS